MKKLSKLSILLVPLMLAACAPTSNPTTSPTVDPTIEPTVEPSVEPTVDPTTAPNADIQKLVTDTIGTKTKLSNHIKKQGDLSVISVNYSSSRETAYSSDESVTSVMFRSNEVCANITSSEMTSTTSNSSSETIYYGVVGETYYEANISDPIFSRVKRSKITDEKITYQPDLISLADAEESVAAVKENYDLSVLAEFGYWKDILSATARQRTYEVTINDDYVRAVLTAYTEGYICTDYTFVLTLDYELRLSSGVLITSKYDQDDWNKETHTVVSDDIIPNSKTKVSLDGVEYGEPLKTGAKPMVDVTPYLIESLTPSLIEFSNFVSNPVTGMPVYSEPNTVFTKAPLDCPIEVIKENRAYLPATALDVESLYITGTSKEGFITADQYGWTVTGQIGDKAKIYIGNSFNEKLAEVEVEIVASPIKNKALISPNLFFVTDATTGGYTYSTGGSRPTLTCTKATKIVAAISTHNEGPFESISVGFVFDKAVLSVKLVEDQAQYYDTVSYSAVYFEIEVLASGESLFAVVDSDTGEGFFEVSVTVNL